MKRDMELIREILLRAEAAESFDPDFAIDGYTDEQIGYHQYLLIEADFANGVDATNLDSVHPVGQISSLTWAGHEFLDTARDPTIWSKAADAVVKLGGASLPIWTAILTALLKEKLGLE